ATTAATKYGYTDDLGVAFHAATALTSGRGPVYRLYNPTTHDHFWTMSTTERQAAMTTFGYTTDEGTGFYASASAASCLVPVYRLYQGASHAHLFTTSAAQRDSLVAAGWTAEGIKLYAGG